MGFSGSLGPAPRAGRWTVPAPAPILGSMDSQGIFSLPGQGAGAFGSLESLAAYFSRYLPPAYVSSLIEAEKEIFVVRRDCTLEETHAQFLRKCDSALRRSLAEAEAGRAGWDWSCAPPAASLGQPH